MLLGRDRMQTKEDNKYFMISLCVKMRRFLKCLWVILLPFGIDIGNLK